MSHDRATLAGAMLSIGIFYCSFAWFGIRRGLPWYREAVLYSALLGFLNFFAFISYGYFDLLHAFVSACLLQIFILAVYAHFPKIRIMPRPFKNNSSVWKRALWGFEARQRWLWWTYLASGYPPYMITLWIHSYIGYESFIHLLPVFIGFALLTISLILSYSYFFAGEEE